MVSCTVDVPPHIMSLLREAADEEGLPVERLLASIVAEGLSRRRDLKTMRERASRSNAEAVMDILDKIPDVRPEAGDEVPSDGTVSNAGRGF